MCELDNAEMLCNFALSVDINLKIAQRKNEYIVYLKDGETVTSFLTLIGAHSSVLRFEEIRVVKDVRNNVNRTVNCETANLNKIVNASVKVINDIKYLQSINKFEELSESLKEIAVLRLRNPNISLKELSELTKVSKSGVSHRLNKITQIANEYKNL